MSSYFDNRYEGEDDDKFKDGDSDHSSSDTDVDPDKDIEDDIEEDIEEEQIDSEDDINDDEESDLEDKMKGGDINEELEEGEIDEEAEEADKKAKRVKKIPSKTVYKKPDTDYDDDDDDDDEDGEMYLQKFDKAINDNYIVDFHPESVIQNYDEILSMIKVVRDSDGIIIDDLHKTIPYLTKYEKARILGQRAKQINAGSYPFVKVPENVIDGYIIAELELKEKRIPFIIRRPLPNGGSEFWSIKDLEDISF
jgi:DNA-directed RNA polymerase I, II, and III subunit RPABC2